MSDHNDDDGATKSGATKSGGGGGGGGGMKVDVAFILDCTSGMGFHIETVNDTIETLTTKVQANFPSLDVCFAFVGYRDSLVCDDDDVECIDFLDTKEALPKFRKHLAGIQATGGGDQCEDVLAGLMQAVNLRGWRKDADLKLAFHIADAPTHGDFFNRGSVSPTFDWMRQFDKNGEPTTKVLKTYCDKNIELIHVRLNSSTDAMIKKYNELLARCLGTKKRIKTIDASTSTWNHRLSAAKMVDVVSKTILEEIARHVNRFAFLHALRTLNTRPYAGPALRREERSIGRSVAYAYRLKSNDSRYLLCCMTRFI